MLSVTDTKAEDRGGSEGLSTAAPIIG